MLKDLTAKTVGLLIAKGTVGKEKTIPFGIVNVRAGGGEKIVPVPYLKNQHTKNGGDF